MSGPRRTATNISGHDRPAGGPVIWPLVGGGQGRDDGSRFHQGYWISPLPPLGPVTLCCEWPAGHIPLVRHEIDAQLILDAAERARAMFPAGSHVSRDGLEWRFGTDADCAWINSGVSPVATIEGAIPPVFSAYCTVALPEGGQNAEMVRHERAVIDVLRRHTQEQQWWLGYLDTGASDVVFPYAPRVKLYCGYGYVLVEAEPRRASTWRERGFNWALPDLMFPPDRGWLLSTMWDDKWSSIGGSEQLVNDILSDSTLGPRARRVNPGQDLTPL